MIAKSIGILGLYQYSYQGVGCSDKLKGESPYENPGARDRPGRQAMNEIAATYPASTNSNHPNA